MSSNLLWSTMTTRKHSCYCNLERAVCISTHWLSTHFSPFAPKLLCKPPVFHNSWRVEMRWMSEVYVTSKVTKLTHCWIQFYSPDGKHFFFFYEKVATATPPRGSKRRVPLIHKRPPPACLHFLHSTGKANLVYTGCLSGFLSEA